MKKLFVMFEWAEVTSN